MDIIKLIKQEEKILQNYIDNGYFDYDYEKDMTLGYVDITAGKVLEKIRKWDFSPYDNLIWHYARINLLKQLKGIA